MKNKVVKKLMMIVMAVTMLSGFSFATVYANADPPAEETTQKNTGSADIWKLCTIVLAGGLGIGAVVVYLKYGRKKEEGFVSEQLEFTDGPFINEEQENEDGQEE